VRVAVRLFASLTDLAGAASLTVELDDEATVGDLWEALARDHPALADIGYRPLVACDLRYAGWDDLLRDVREVAFLPPVSGG